MPHAASPWLPAAGLFRRRAVIALSALLLAALPVCLPSHARAQAIPDALSASPRDTRFILMPPNAGNHCAAGIYKAAQGRTGAHCQLSINECLGIPGATIQHTPGGNWGCYRQH
jgi:hypothetical protein